MFLEKDCVFHLSGELGTLINDRYHGTFIFGVHGAHEEGDRPYGGRNLSQGVSGERIENSRPEQSASG
jgi:hypothetical protein